MNNIKQYTLRICLLLLFIGVTSCNDDFVNTKPLDEVPNSDTWSDPALSEAFILDIYNGFGQGGLDEQMQASLTDESLFTHSGRGINTITESRSNPVDQGWINSNYNWTNMYSRIRATNVAMSYLEEPLFDNKQVSDRLLGEAHFLRAFYYHQLLRYYGAVPLIDRVYGLGEEDYLSSRNTWEVCVNFIVADCDKAAALLAGQPTATGRATDVAALALKARILVYAASDLHDIPTASANSATIGGYTNPEFLGYVSGDQTARWEKAKAAAKAVVDKNLGYKLNLSAPVSPRSE